MNRQNFWGHLALALTLVVLAGFVGQIRRWHNWQTPKKDTPRFERIEEIREAGSDEAEIPESEEVNDGAEVLVRFRQGTTLERIKALALRNNDRFEDEYESVNGLVALEDEDGLDAEEVAAEYRALADVEYAEPVYLLYADHGAPGKHKHANDARFDEQW